MRALNLSELNISCVHFFAIMMGPNWKKTLMHGDIAMPYKSGSIFNVLFNSRGDNLILEAR